MRRPPRIAVVLPAAVAVTVAMPLLRGLPGGMALPDPLLLLLLAAVPRRLGQVRRAAAWVFLFGLLRASVSAASPFASWAGYGLGLAMRSLAQRYLAEDRFLARLLLGVCAALPLGLLDHLVSARLFAPMAIELTLARMLLVGLLWAVAMAPPPMRRELAS
ncbi:MAG: hypothetical protein H8E31_14920 [Planctomycetes bacterium]|nr:hypothetical protein [Planctomycetota bacterium]